MELCNSQILAAEAIGKRRLSKISSILKNSKIKNHKSQITNGKI